MLRWLDDPKAHGQPKELYLARAIDRWGVQAVLNRPYIGGGEIRRIVAVEYLERIYREWSKALSGKHFAAWAKEHAEELEYLGELQRLLEEDADGEG